MILTHITCSIPVHTVQFFHQDLLIIMIFLSLTACHLRYFRWATAIAAARDIIAGNSRIATSVDSNFFLPHVESCPAHSVITVLQSAETLEFTGSSCISVHLKVILIHVPAQPLPAASDIRILHASCINCMRQCPLASQKTRLAAGA